MNFEQSKKVVTLCKKLHSFMYENIFPVEQEFREYMSKTSNKWETPPLFEKLKQKARSEGLWNLFLPDKTYGAGLTNLEYAPLAEIMGQVWWAPEIFNCNAPDTGNMETLVLYGTDLQKKQWLDPLLEGEIRSAFAMTEPDVASSDATNIKCSIKREKGLYIINGRKWFTTGAMRNNCEIFIVMGKTDANNSNRHAQQSMILVPKKTPGVKIVRKVKTLGFDDAPFGEPEILFENVCVPVENILLEEGRGFEIAQGRLGPGRIHHCMRLIGAANRALKMILDRVEKRSTFGSKFSQNQSIREDIAKSWCEIEQARLLTLKTASAVDTLGSKEARNLISAIKIVAPTMAQTIIDRSMQIHGGEGLTDDLPLAELFNYARQIRIADGPDQVHMMALARRLIKEHHTPKLQFF